MLTIIKQNKNKLIKSTIIEIVFTALLILLLIFFRHQSLNYLDEIQTEAYGITLFQNQLQTNNISLEEQNYLRENLNTLSSKLDRALILVKYILPLSLLILCLVFYFLIWKINSNIKIKKFVIATTIPIILLLLTSYFTLNIIAYSFNYIENNPSLLLLISLTLLVITYYISLFILSTKKPIKESLKLSIKSLPRIILPYLFILFTDFIYLVLIFLMFILTFAKANILYPSIALVILIVIINLQRVHLVNKISKI